jgi:hypothetical protein
VEGPEGKFYPKHGTIGYTPDPTTYDSYQMPGAQNYRETLIQLDRPGQKITTLRDGFADGESFGTEHFADKGPQPFKSHHWEEPNVLVHVRHNERVLPADARLSPDVEARMKAGEFVPAPRGRMLENVQSDWEQRGANSGYRNADEEANGIALNPELQTALSNADADLIQKVEDLNARLMFPVKREEGVPLDDWVGEVRHQANEDLTFTGPDYDSDPKANKELNDALRLVHDAQAARHNIIDSVVRETGNRVPDMPFKGMSGPPTLALKQQLLDVADRPDLDWLGIAPSSELQSRGEDISEEFQDKMLPNVLEKLLGPFGGKVEKADLGIKSTHVSDPISVLPENNLRAFNTGQELGPHGGLYQPATANNKSQPLLSFLRPPETTDDINDLKNQIINQRPNLQAFIARLSPEMKQAIKEKGFPLLMMLLAQQMNQGEQ